MDLLKSGRQFILACLFLMPFSAVLAQDQLTDAFRESYVLEENGQYIRAAQRLQQVYQAESYELNLRLGWLFYQGGNMGEAINFYGKASALKPYAIEPRFGIVLPYSAMGRWDEVLTQYNRILDVDPQNTVANYRIGLIFYNRGQYARAEPYLEKIINLYPFDYDSLLLFGWTKLQLGKMREASVLFNKVLLHTPGDPSAREGLSLIK